jgi:hypothetical protein
VKDPDLCAVPRCRAEAELTYRDRPVCGRDWRRLCEPSTRPGLLKKLRLPPDPPRPRPAPAEITLEITSEAEITAEITPDHPDREVKFPERFCGFRRKAT